MNEHELLTILHRETAPTLGERIAFAWGALLYRLAIRRPWSLADLDSIGCSTGSTYREVRAALDRRSAERLGLPLGLPSRAYAIADVLHLLGLLREITDHDSDAAACARLRADLEASRKSEARAIADSIRAEYLDRVETRPTT